jgi:SAM-dependent methyltransferase
MVFGDKFQNTALGLSDELLSSLIVPGDRVADLGCGTGRWSRASARRAAHVFGIDANSQTLEKAKLLGGGVEYLELDLDMHLDEMPNVDLTLMIHFLEHIENPLTLLKGIREKSNRIVIEVPDFESDPLNYARLWTSEPFYFDSDHLREFSLTELQDLLGETGWTPINVSQKGGTILIVAV